MVKKIVLIKPRGFCAGVDRAIDVVKDCLELFGAPIYVKHEIVHNKHVVGRLEKQGVITIEDVNEVPEGSVCVFSAHGSPPSDYENAKKRNLKVIDATCPLVTKVHLEVHRFAKQGYEIFYIGHKGHAEALGVMGELPEKMTLIETPEDVEKLESKSEKLIYLTQTTLSLDETKAIISALKKKFPHISEPPKEDICYATTNRQTAVKNAINNHKVEVVIVVGSKNSSNSNRLRETAEREGAEAYLVDDKSELKENWFEGKNIIGITAGASAPDDLVKSIADYFKEKNLQIEEIDVVKENMKFIEPIELANIKKAREKK